MLLQKVVCLRFNMSEFINLSQQELSYLIKNNDSFIDVVKESKGEVLGLLDSYKIDYPLEKLLQNDIFIYSCPYLLKKDLTEKQSSEMKVLLGKIGSKYITEKISDVQSLINLLNFIHTIKRLTPKAKIKDLNIEIDLTNLLESSKQLDENLVKTISSTIEVKKIFLKSWKNLSKNEKENFYRDSSVVWAFCSLMNNDLFDYSDEKMNKFIEHTTSFSNAPGVKEKLLNYLYDMDLKSKNKLYVVGELLNEWKEKKDNTYDVLSNSKFKDQLSDIRYLLDMRYNFFIDIEKNNGVSLIIDQETFNKNDSFSIFLKNMNMSKGFYTVIEKWIKITKNNINYEEILSDNLFETLQEIYRDKTVNAPYTLDNVSQVPSEKEFFIKLFEFIIEKSHNYLDNNKIDFKNILFITKILSEYLLIIHHSKDSFWKNDVYQEDVLNILNKTTEVFKKIIVGLGDNANSIIAFNYPEPVKLYLAGLLNKYSFPDIIPSFEKILIKEKSKDNRLLIGNYDILSEDKKTIVDLLFNKERVPKNIDAKPQVISRLRKIANSDDDINEVIVLLNNQLSNDIGFLDELTKEKIIVHEKILERMLDAMASKSKTIKLILKNYINMINNVNSSLITDKLIVHVLQFIGEDFNKKTFFDNDNFVEKSNQSLMNLLDNGDLNFIPSKVYDDFQNFLLSKEKFDDILKLREININSQLMGFDEPLTSLKMEDLKKVLMDENRFRKFMSPLQSKLMKKRDLGLDNPMDKVKFEMDKELFTWVHKYFKDYPLEQHDLYPLELALFKFDDVKYKSYLLENYPHYIVQLKNSLIEDDGFTQKDFECSIKSYWSIESHDNFKKEVSKEIKFISNYLDKLLTLKDYKKLLENFKEPQEYAIIVGLANQSIMSKTSFYSKEIDVEKFLDGVQILISHNSKYNEMFENSFSKVISLSDENKEKIIFGFIDLGLSISENTFYEADKYIEKLSNNDLCYLIKNSYHKNGSGVLLDIFLKRDINNIELLIELKNAYLQYEALGKITNTYAINTKTSPQMKELKEHYQRLDMFKDVSEDFLSTLEILIDKEILNKITNNSNMDTKSVLKF